MRKRLPLDWDATDQICVRVRFTLYLDDASLTIEKTFQHLLCVEAVIRLVEREFEKHDAAELPSTFQRPSTSLSILYGSGPHHTPRELPGTTFGSLR